MLCGADSELPKCKKQAVSSPLHERQVDRVRSGDACSIETLENKAVPSDPKNCTNAHVGLVVEASMAHNQGKSGTCEQPCIEIDGMHALG